MFRGMEFSTVIHFGDCLLRRYARGLFKHSKICMDIILVEHDPGKS